MFEKEIQFMTDFNLNKIKNLGTSFTFNELFNNDLHPALIKYISGRIDLMIYEDRKILLENSRFDYSGGKIAEYFNLISNEIKKTRKLTFREAEEFVKKGVIFNANFIVQPKSTLTNLIYKDTDGSKSSPEVKIFLNYLYYYDYYREIIDSYISRRRIVNLSKNEFRSLLDKIDNQLLLSKKEIILSDAITSISDFYNDGGISKSAVQPALVEAFLKEKELNPMVEMLHKELKDNKKKIDIVELKKIIFALPHEKPAEEVLMNEPVNPEPEVEPEIKKELLDDIEFNEVKKETMLNQKENLKEEIQEDFTNIPEIEKEVLPNPEAELEKSEPEIEIPQVKFKEEKPAEQVDIPETETENLPEEKSEQKTEAPREIVEEEKGEEIKPTSADEIKKENIPQTIESDDETSDSEQEMILQSDEEEIENDNILEEEIIENYNPESEIDIDELIEEDFPLKKEFKKRKDIFSFLSQKDVDRIVSGVFNDDEDDFISTLEKISECNDYDKAAEILQSVFFSYKVNPYKREAVTLTNVVSNYFDQD